MYIISRGSLHTAKCNLIKSTDNVIDVVITLSTDNVIV